MRRTADEAATLKHISESLQVAGLILTGASVSANADAAALVKWLRFPLLIAHGRQGTLGEE